MAHILVVDDHEDLVRVVCGVLVESGHEVTGLTSGAAALAYLSDHVPDLVLLDVSMPGVDGLSVLRSLRADSRTAGLPIIMFSTYGDEWVRKAAMDAGATDFWVKADLDVPRIAERLKPYLGVDDDHAGA